MVDIVFHVSSTAVNATTCLCETPANLRAENSAATSSAACVMISAAASCLLVTLLVLFLKATLHIVTNWHGRFLRLFLRVTLLRPSAVDRTCPGHDRGSSAGTRQGGPTSSSASVQPALALPVYAGRRRNIGGKRSGDDGSDAEDNNRPKRPRVVSQKDTQPSFVCPFRARYPDNPKYLTCGVYHEWCRLREHLLDRKHKPRYRCSTCGEIFTDDVEWDLHTSDRTCERSLRALEMPFWVEKDQATRIRGLAKRGSKTESMEEMYRKVWNILFGSESGPDRTALFPHFQHTDDLDVDHGRQESWNVLKRKIANILGMQNVPRDDSMEQVIYNILSYHGYPRGQTHAVPSHVPGAGDAAADEQLGNNEAVDNYWMPRATPTEGQAPQISEPDRYAPEGSEGEFEHSLSNISTFLSEEAGDPSPPVSLDATQASIVGHSLEKHNSGSGCVNPVVLQRQDTHHIHVPMLNDSSTSAALPSASAASQSSEATALGSSWDQILGDADYSKRGEIPDDLDNFDFSVDGFSPDIGWVQPSDGQVPDQQSEYQDVPGFE